MQYIFALHFHLLLGWNIRQRLGMTQFCKRLVLFVHSITNTQIDIVLSCFYAHLHDWIGSNPQIRGVLEARICAPASLLFRPEKMLIVGSTYWYLLVVAFILTGFVTVSKHLWTDIGTLTFWHKTINSCRFTMVEWLAPFVNPFGDVCCANIHQKCLTFLEEMAPGIRTYISSHTTGWWTNDVGPFYTEP